MKINNISNFFVKADNISDYVPGVSTVSNLVDLFEKSVVLPKLKRSGTDINKNPYFTHVNKKSFSRCALLLIPFLGNAIFGIHDFSQRKYNNKNLMLAAVKKDGAQLQDASDELKADRDVVRAAVQQEGMALQYAHDDLKADEEIVRTAIDNNGSALAHASDDLKDKKEIVLYAVQRDGKAIWYASDDLKADDEVLNAAKKHGDWILNVMKND